METNRKQRVFAWAWGHSAGLALTDIPPWIEFVELSGHLADQLL